MAATMHTYHLDIKFEDAASGEFLTDGDTITARNAAEAERKALKHYPGYAYVTDIEILEEPVATLEAEPVAEAEGAEGPRIVPVLSPVACQFCGREYPAERIGRMRNPIFDGEENLTFCPGYGCEQPPF